MWKQPVIVESRPGAGSVLGVDSVAKSPPDGHTLVFTDSASFVIAPHLNDTLPYDPLRDLAPLALCVKIAPVLAVAADTPFNSVAELVAHAKANPGKLSFPSAGNGTTPHIAGELFLSMAGVKMVHVPYKSTGQSMPDLLAGRVAMYIATLSVFDPVRQGGQAPRCWPPRPKSACRNARSSRRWARRCRAISSAAGSAWGRRPERPAAILDRIHADVAKKPAASPPSPHLFVDKQFSHGGYARAAPEVRRASSVPSPPEVGRAGAHLRRQRAQ